MTLIDLPESAEYIIYLIKKSCKNTDDLSKIAEAVECLFEEIEYSSKSLIKKEALRNI